MSDYGEDRALFQAFTLAIEPKRIYSFGDENEE
jgi:hypothetical protein